MEFLGLSEPLWLLLLFCACALLSLGFCWIAKLLFPKFRSGEFKPGPHRSDMPSLPASGREIRTIELPLVGGPALTLAIIGTGILAGYIFNLSADQWHLLLIGLGALTGYMLVGLADDWHKVFSQEGLSERAKFAGVFLVSIGAAACYYFLYNPTGVPHHLPPSASQPYSPYSDILGAIFTRFPFTWLIILMLATGIIGSVTSLSVDFSDGLDGLAGGMVFSAALAFGIIVSLIVSNVKEPHPERIVLEILSLLTAAGTLGFLRWNWPSSWAARRGSAKRRAKIYMGDSGALALGGILAVIAIFARQEFLLLMIGCAFVLEGLSAFSSRTITRFYRKHLKLLRFASMRERVHHTEFPLPFLATPLHHHFDLLGWDRRRLVYGAWALAACFATLGVLVVIWPETWQRYLLRTVVLLIAWLVWSSGGWTRRYFVGKHPAERTRRRRLALFYGFPYRIVGLRLYHLVEMIEANEDVIETPIEDGALWQRMNIYDARAMLGLYCYRAGYYPAALAQWTRIPSANRVLRPDITRLLEELDSRLALEKQETQPMRRDQIMKQEPILTGNLGPADLPNPHAPISAESVLEDSLNGWPTPHANALDLEKGSFSVATQVEEKPSVSPRQQAQQALDGTKAEFHTMPGNPQAPSSDAPEEYPSWQARMRYPSHDNER
jgi:UDP-N-acetylmuramyl pentapeptide phosphotransferase/UDP-N-acetylglucosamine-1-phosphate transferase